MVKVLEIESDFFSGQFKRKEEQWKEKLANAQENEQDVVSEFEDSGPNDLSHLQPISRRDLLKEVNRLTTERQLLQYQLRVDSDEVQKNITNIKFEFESKLKLRDEMIEELQISLKENQFRKDKLEDDLQQRTKELRETCECLETLKTDLGKARKDAEEEFSGNLDQERQAFQEEFAKMEKVVDEARREHTKAIISLRQIEKKLEWEKQKSVDTLSRQEEEYECKIRKLSDKIILLEKERNLLLTTVRQEGLKLPREKPLPLDTSLEESEVERVNVDLTRKGKKVKRKKPPKSKSNDITNLQGNSGHSDTLLYHKNDTKDLTEVLRDLTSMCASIQRNEQEQDEEVPASSTSAEF